MAGKLEYRIIKNKPDFGSNAQYFFNTETEKWYYQTGIETLAIGDDLYSLHTSIYLNLIDDYGFGDGPSTEVWDYVGDILPNFDVDQSPPSINQPNFRFLSHVFTGTDVYTGTHLQKYHELGSLDYIMSSAPNLVTLSFDMVYDDGQFIPEEISALDKDSYYFKFLVLNFKNKNKV